MSKLENDTLESLRRIKREMKAKKQLKADMWCHFGMFVLRRPIEGMVRNRSKVRGGRRAGAFLFWPTSFVETLPILGAEKC